MQYITATNIVVESEFTLTGVIVVSGEVVNTTSAKDLKKARMGFLRRNKGLDPDTVEVLPVKEVEEKPVMSKDEQYALTLERIKTEQHYCQLHGIIAPELLSIAYARRRVIRCRLCENTRSLAAKAAARAKKAEENV